MSKFKIYRVTHGADACVIKFERLFDAKDFILDDLYPGVKLTKTRTENTISFSCEGEEVAEISWK